MTDAPTRRNDLPARAAKRIMAKLFHADLPGVNAIAVAAYKARLETDIMKAIWEEQVAMTGEREVEAREGKLPE